MKKITIYTILAIVLPMTLSYGMETIDPQKSFQDQIGLITGLIINGEMNTLKNMDLFKQLLTNHTDELDTITKSLLTFKKALQPDNEKPNPGVTLAVKTTEQLMNEINVIQNPPHLPTQPTPQTTAQTAELPDQQKLFKSITDSMETPTPASTKIDAPTHDKEISLSWQQQLLHSKLFITAGTATGALALIVSGWLLIRKMR